MHQQVPREAAGPGRFYELVGMQNNDRAESPLQFPLNDLENVFPEQSDAETGAVRKLSIEQQLE